MGRGLPSCQLAASGSPLVVHLSYSARLSGLALITARSAARTPKARTRRGMVGGSWILGLETEKPAQWRAFNITRRSTRMAQIAADSPYLGLKRKPPVGGSLCGGVPSLQIQGALSHLTASSSTTEPSFLIVWRSLSA